MNKVRQEDVLAAGERVGLDIDEGQQGGDESFDLVGKRFAVGPFWSR